MDYDARQVYLGCNSGIVYCISKDGFLIKQLVCNDRILTIKKIGNHLFIRTIDYLYIFINDKCHSKIKLPKIKTIFFDDYMMWTEENLLIVGTKEIILYSKNGDFIGKVEFKPTVYHAFCEKDKLYVTTRTHKFIFSIGCQLELLSFNKTRHLLP